MILIYDISWNLANFSDFPSSSHAMQKNSQLLPIDSLLILININDYLHIFWRITTYSLNDYSIFNFDFTFLCKLKSAEFLFYIIFIYFYQNQSLFQFYFIFTFQGMVLFSYIFYHHHYYRLPVYQKIKIYFLDMQLWKRNDCLVLM